MGEEEREREKNGASSWWVDLQCKIERFSSMLFRKVIVSVFSCRNISFTMSRFAYFLCLSLRCVVCHFPYWERRYCLQWNCKHLSQRSSVALIYSTSAHNTHTHTHKRENVHFPASNNELSRSMTGADCIRNLCNMEKSLHAHFYVIENFSLPLLGRVH